MKTPNTAVGGMIGTAEVMRGLKDGGKLVWLAPELRDGDFEIRMDFTNGDFWFLSKTIIKDLRGHGVEIPNA